MSEAISILFAGDFAPCRRYEALALDKGEQIFGDLADDISGADIAFLNLEAPLCVGGEAISKAGPNLKAHPDCIQAVANVGFNVIGLANNHIMDFGEEGLEETLSVCKQASLRVCGAGANLAEAQRALVVEIKGFRVALIAVAEHEFSIAESDRPGAAPLDPIDNVRQISQIRQDVDLVFVTIHGGNEYFPYPRPGLRKLCRFLIEMGADGVMCHHAHVAGVYEYYQGKPIVYSLGNLVFDHTKPPSGWNEGYAIKLTYGANEKEPLRADIVPYEQSVEQGGIRKMDGEKKEQFLKKLSSYGEVLSDELVYVSEWKKFCDKKSASAIMGQYSPFLFRGVSRLFKMKLFQNLLLPPSSLERRENMLACESHHELLLSVVRKKNA